MDLPVKIKRLSEDAVLPKYAKEGDACMDVVAISCKYDEELDCFVYGTGLAFELPENYDMKIYPRSSIRKTNCYLSNSVGVLDSGYRGELIFSFKPRTSSVIAAFIQAAIKAINRIGKHVGLGSFNLTVPEAKAPYEIGDRVGQIQINRYPSVNWIEVKELAESERGAGGHGSTGR